MARCHPWRQSPPPEADYHFLAVTDHFRAEYGFPLTDTRPLSAPGFTTLLGAGLHAPRTGAGPKWHIVAVGLPLGIPPPDPGDGLGNDPRPALSKAIVPLFRDAVDQLGLRLVEITPPPPPTRSWPRPGSHLAPPSPPSVLTGTCRPTTWTACDRTSARHGK